MYRIFCVLLLSVFISGGLFAKQETNQKETAETGYVYNGKDVVEKEVTKQVKRYVSECAKRADRIVYRPVCRGCGSYSVSVRRNNCCYDRECR